MTEMQNKYRRLSHISLFLISACVRLSIYATMELSYPAAVYRCIAGRVSQPVLPQELHQ